MRASIRVILSQCLHIWRNMALGPPHPSAGDRNASHPVPVPSASAINGVVRRKRTYVSSNSVPHVFVVDDEPVIASALAAILKLHGYSARAFTSPLEVLAAARSRAPDLLIADVVMSGLSGIDLANQMLAQSPECKILLFSGQTTTRELLRDAHKQGNSFPLLQKPVQPSITLLSMEVLAGEKRS
jgi:CheY-like chemotaxis protein